MEMDQLVALCKRRGFLFQSSEIYGGLQGFWDYGPLGVELKRNVREAWWRDMVTGHDDLDGPARRPVGLRNGRPGLRDHHAPAGLEVSPAITTCSTISWSIAASRSTATATTRCRAAGSRTKGQAGLRRQRGQRRRRRRGTAAEGPEVLQPPRQERRRAAMAGRAGLAGHGRRTLRAVLGPDAKTLGTLTEPREFNLMFKTIVGALGGEEDAAFLRPETAQGIFVNFKNVLDSTRVGIPFGIAQIGKSFRNEITPRNFTFRSREFEQMEIEFFCHPGQSLALVSVLARSALPVVSRPGPGRRAAAAARPHARRVEPLFLRHGRHRIRLPLPAAGRVRRAGRRGPSRRFRPPQPHGRQARHGPSDKKSPLVVEKDADGKPRHRGSGKDMTYFDDQTKERFIPHVIEPSAGADRATLAFLCEAYTEDEVPDENGKPPSGCR